MKATIVPTASDVLAVLGQTVDSVIKPAMTTQAQRSAATTLRHLLRYVSIRIESEGQILFDELRRLQPLLVDAETYLASDAAGNHAGLIEAIRASRTSTRGLEVYLSVALLSEDVAALRQHVSDVLVVLQTSGKDEAGLALRAKLRDYIAWQIEREAQIIEPAFRGHGMRR